MSVNTLMLQCRAAGIAIIVRGEQLCLEGPSDGVAYYTPLLRPYKGQIMAEANALVEEFMEVDGLSFEEAAALVLVSVPRLSSAEWVDMIAELDRLIESYCDALHLPEEIRARIRGARKRHSLALIPTVSRWFRDEIEQASDKTSANGRRAQATNSN